MALTLLVVVVVGGGALALAAAAGDAERDARPPAAEPGEVLVVLDAAGAERTAQAVGRHVRVVQQLPPRVLVATGTVPSIAEVSALPGVSAVVTRSSSAPMPAGLTAEERLFVGAWRSRQRPKQRPGEGLKWDAPGYTPPG